MAAPTFVTHTATVFNTTTTPKTASVAAQAGDLLVALGVSADSTIVIQTPTNDGTALTWTAQRTDATASHTWIGIWTAIVDTTRTIVVTFASPAATGPFGGDVIVWRSATVGTVPAASIGSGAPSFNFTTTAANSAICVAIGDWAAVVGSPTWRVNAGAFTSTFEQPGDAATYSARGGYHADAGAIATYAIGVTAPGAETWALVSIEIQGPAGAVLLKDPRTKMGFRDSRGLQGPGLKFFRSIVGPLLPWLAGVTDVLETCAELVT